MKPSSRAHRYHIAEMTRRFPSTACSSRYQCHCPECSKGQKDVANTGANITGRFCQTQPLDSRGLINDVLPVPPQLIQPLFEMQMKGPYLAEGVMAKPSVQETTYAELQNKCDLEAVNVADKACYSPKSPATPNPIASTTKPEILPLNLSSKQYLDKIEALNETITRLFELSLDELVMLKTSQTIENLEDQNLSDQTISHDMDTEETDLFSDKKTKYSSNPYKNVGSTMMISSEESKTLFNSKTSEEYKTSETLRDLKLEIMKFLNDKIIFDDPLSWKAQDLKYSIIPCTLFKIQVHGDVRDHDQCEGRVKWIFYIDIGLPGDGIDDKWRNTLEEICRWKTTYKLCEKMNPNYCATIYAVSFNHASSRACEVRVPINQYQILPPQ